MWQIESNVFMPVYTLGQIGHRWKKNTDSFLSFVSQIGLESDVSKNGIRLKNEAAAISIFKDRRQIIFFPFHHFKQL